MVYLKLELRVALRTFLLHDLAFNTLYDEVMASQISSVFRRSVGLHEIRLFVKDLIIKEGTCQAFIIKYLASKYS